MLLKEIIGKRITNIYCLYGKYDEWLDTAECFIELDKQWIIDIPRGWFEGDYEIELLEVKPGALSFFGKKYDYHFKSESKPTDEIVEDNKNFLHKLFSRLFGHKPIKKENGFYDMDADDDFKHFKDRVIVDFIWYNRIDEKGFFLLDSGYLITHTLTSPEGTGLAGINIFESIEELTELSGSDYEKISDK
ncbi:hypothetical protein [Emticicia sp. C21]|uniref:hypothetical protein n=1 Tax=Emticicia sp. C21 TaxID=2302915 RepID=UPI000E351710|nr:hypothetical protein [Emticicia sp. C21]RFS17717.1 hypothetical protein D0T08_00225 [Emticicia sp. C21]